MNRLLPVIIFLFCFSIFALSDYYEAEKYVQSGVSKTASGNYRGAILDLNQALELDPRDANAYYNRALAEYKLGDTRGALVDFSKTIDFDPKMAQAYYGRGKIRSDYGYSFFKLADQDYTMAIGLDSKYEDAYFFRGFVRDALGDHKGAVEDYNKVILLDPNRVEAYVNRGSTENNAGDYNGAIADFDKALEFNPKNWMFFYWRGNAEDKLGNTGNAIKDYVTAIGFHTDRSQVVYGTCIDAMVKAGDYAGAIKIAGDWINISPIANTYAIRGEIEYKSGDYKSAIADYSKAIEINPNQGDEYQAGFYYKRARIKAAMKDDQGAIEDFVKSIKIRNWTAAGLITKEDNAAAKADYEEAIKLADASKYDQDKTANDYFIKGKAALDAKNYEEAVKWFDDVIKIDPKNTMAIGHRNWAQGKIAEKFMDSAMNTNNTAAAIKDYDESIGINPKYREAFWRRGNAKLQIKDYKGAIEDFGSAIELNQGYYAQAFCGRGFAKDKLGDHKGAIEDYAQAMEDSPWEAEDNIKQYAGADHDYAGKINHDIVSYILSDDFNAADIKGRNPKDGLILFYLKYNDKANSAEFQAFLDKIGVKYDKIDMLGDGKDEIILELQESPFAEMIVVKEDGNSLKMFTVGKRAMDDKPESAGFIDAFKHTKDSGKTILTSSYEHQGFNYDDIFASKFAGEEMETVKVCSCTNFSFKDINNDGIKELICYHRTYPEMGTPPTMQVFKWENDEFVDHTKDFKKFLEENGM